jgi:hypothetical protein
MPPRFVADSMLGRLAKWLRAFGFDVDYHPFRDDHGVIARARERGAIALTGDAEFPQPADVRVIFVASDHLPEQLEQLARDVPLHLTQARPFTRCIVCNQALLPVTRDQVWRDIPPFIYLTNESYARCPDCGRVYWEGSHASHMQEGLSKLATGATAGRKDA